MSEDLLAASVRLLSKDQKLIPILLRYFEQSKSCLALSLWIDDAGH